VGRAERKVVRDALIWPLLGILISLAAVTLLSIRVLGINYFLQSRKSQTLEMSWHRGDLYYGPNFIHLESPCLSSSEAGCFCASEFKVTASKEFADYIESFGSKKIPVQYAVDYANQKVVRASLLSVGDWPKTRFHENEGSLATGFRMFPATNRKSGGHLSNPGDCFPPAIQ
jgi:hypothetical protein